MTRRASNIKVNTTERCGSSWWRAVIGTTTSINRTKRSDGSSTIFAVFYSNCGEIENRREQVGCVEP